MPHPRRSQQYRSTRPRRLRGHDRDSRSRRIYVAEGRTLLLHVTAHDRTFCREERVERAVVNVTMAERAVAAIRRDLAWYIEPLTMTERARSRGVARIQGWLTENKAALADALWELKQAKTSASRPAAVRVTLEVTRLPPPRTWSNALPGGTSPRRALDACCRAFERDALAGRPALLPVPARLGVTHATAARPDLVIWR